MKGLIINGPNLNMLGKRDQNLYGILTLKEINSLIEKEFPELFFEFFQSNYEGAIIDKLADASKFDFLLINPGGLAHYSVVLRDAFELVNIPKGVCHLSKIETRETFRNVDLLKDLADVYVSGLQERSYLQAIKEIKEKLK